MTANFDFSNFFIRSVRIVYCLQIHKFYFSATFLVKIGLMVLFTHLKIILLQYFSVFSFSFQFSAVSKRTLRSIKKNCIYPGWLARCEVVAGQGNLGMMWIAVKFCCVCDFIEINTELSGRKEIPSWKWCGQYKTDYFPLFSSFCSFELWNDSSSVLGALSEVVGNWG